MAFIFHSLVALSYIALAAAAAFGLPLLSTGIEPMLALFAGGAVLVIGALGHQSVVNGTRGRYIAQELSVVASTNEAMLRDLEEARNELREIKSQVGGGHLPSPAGADLEANTRSSNEVLGELRLLRILFSQLTSKKGAKKNAAPVQSQAPRQDNAPPLPTDPGLGLGLDPVPDSVPDPADNALELDTQPTAETVSEYRASYMNLSSSMHRQDESEMVQFPGGQNQRITAAQPPGSNAQDILAITRDALERARVSLFLQPIVSLPTRRVEYYEAYSRIQDHAGNFIGPKQYLELAERAGLVGAIDNNLLFRCIQLLRRVRRHNRDYGFFCNVSPHTLRDDAFFGQFIEFLSENLELVDDLIFEFSQADVETHYNEVAENLDRLAKLGFSFSIDRVERLDFNFSEIAKRNFHYIKVDAANLISLAGTERGQEQFHYLQQDLMDSRVTMIVEKIETEPQLVELLDHNISFGQGYLFGEPRESKT
ncbi:MAG: EAL domain-containing protein [Alphaproteobacteria bacterium]|jgi:cyclic-di-GMP phosphodiesterase TipF (flagellum assembly factor)|nr:EAL domain-containing protein [Alphaproteobacteria bacterium]MDP6589943.1 EAL domain-containing protein [Alphaproteobacteria bacterium]MDP6816899.1 EAL domain-containing protein [Alphaproteobacteria bacterium]